VEGADTASSKGVRGMVEIKAGEHNAFVNLLQKRIKELEECLQEAITLMEDVRTGDYKPDTLTTQPWKQALEGKENR